MKEFVSINDQIHTLDDAKISVFDRGFLFGDAIYEVTRSYGRILFQLDSHVDRLFVSAERMLFNLGKTKEEYMSHIYDVYKKSDMDDAYVRIQISRGQGPIGMSIKLTKKPNEVIFVYPFKPYDADLYSKGASVYISKRLRNTKKALDPDIKSGNYLNNVLAFAEGEEINAHETFMLNYDGQITEGCTSNIFIIKDSKIITPPKAFDILKGITRRIVIEKAMSLGFEVVERGFALEELYSADEAFITSSTREVMPIGSVNEKPIKTSPGAITVQLHEEYKKYIDDYCENAKKTHPWR